MVSVGVFTSFFLVGIVLRALTFYKKGIHFFISYIRLEADVLLRVSLYNNRIERYVGYQNIT